MLPMLMAARWPLAWVFLRAGVDVLVLGLAVPAEHRHRVWH